MTGLTTKELVDTLPHHFTLDSRHKRCAKIQPLKQCFSTWALRPNCGPSGPIVGLRIFEMGLKFSKGLQ